VSIPALTLAAAAACLCRSRLEAMREMYQKESEMPTTLRHHEMLAATGNDPFYDRFPWFRLIGRCVQTLLFLFWSNISIGFSALFLLSGI